MSNATVQLNWGDGPTDFRLGIGELLALEKTFDSGAIEILDRFRERRWRLAETREILRLGLLGSGYGMEAANRLIQKYFDDMAIAPAEHGVFALAVLTVGLTMTAGASSEQGEAGAATSKTEASASTPPPSTGQAPEWGGHQPKSKPARSRSSTRPSKAGTKARPAKSRSSR